MNAGRRNATFDGAPDVATVVADGDGTITGRHSGAEHVMGWTADEMRTAPSDGSALLERTLDRPPACARTTSHAHDEADAVTRAIRHKNCLILEQSAASRSHARRLDFDRELMRRTMVLIPTAPRGATNGDRAMANGIKINDLLRLTGVLAVAVAVAWAVQVLDFGGSSALGTLAWVIAAAAIAGGGTGLILTSITARGGETALNA